MHDKKQDHNHQSPDLSKLKAVKIDKNTTIYIAPEEDPEEAKQRFVSRVGYRRP
jgi:hypothetical protein